jgi:hypothetical protein
MQLLVKYAHNKLAYSKRNRNLQLMSLCNDQARPLGQTALKITNRYRCSLHLWNERGLKSGEVEGACMRLNEKILSSLYVEEVASKDEKGMSEIATAISPPSSWQHWYHAFMHVLPIYIAVHLAFIVTTIFSQLFILSDFSAKSLPLHSLWKSWDRWDTGGYIAIAMQGYNTLPMIAFFPLSSLLIKCVTFLIPNPLLAGLIISDLAGLLLLVVLYRLVQEDFNSARADRTILYLMLFRFCVSSRLFKCDKTSKRCISSYSEKRSPKLRNVGSDRSA